MCGTGKESGSDAIHGGARDVAPYYFFGVNIPSSGLASLGDRGGLSLFYSEKNVRTVCSMKIRQLSFYGGGVRGVRMSNE